MSVNAVYNKKGVPLIAHGKRTFITTTGAPIHAKTQNPAKPVEEPSETINVDKLPIVSWGDGNTFPKDAETIIGKTGVLNTGLKFIRNFTIGQGIYPVNVTGFDDNGNETIKVVDDPKIRRFVMGRMVRKYLEKGLRDRLKFGRAFPQMIMNADGSQMVGISEANAMFCRLTKANKGIIENCIISGNWPDNPEVGNYTTIPMLDEYDPFADLDRRRIAGKVAGKSFIYPLKDSWSNNEYYPLPIWWAAKEAGWIDVANKIPVFLKKAYDNQITWMWHVQIPYAYWDKKYPLDHYENELKREEAIQKEMDDVEDTLTSEENAHKTLFTMFEVGPNGKAEEQWMIERLDNKGSDQDRLYTSAAANNEIMFSIMLNPNVMGAGMPGGTYAGNQGGSNIREAYLINVANGWLDRQDILDPVELYLAYNGVKDVELRFRNTILTTLDTGSGTKEVQT